MDTSICCRLAGFLWVGIRILKLFFCFVVFLRLSHSLISSPSKGYKWWLTSGSQQERMQSSQCICSLKRGVTFAFIGPQTSPWPVRLFSFQPDFDRGSFGCCCVWRSEEKWARTLQASKRLLECGRVWACVFVSVCVCVVSYVAVCYTALRLLSVFGWHKFKKKPIPAQTGALAAAWEDRGGVRSQRKLELCLCVPTSKFVSLSFFVSVCFLAAVAFHSPPVTIKKEPQSPGSDPSQSCSHKQTFSYPSGEQCLYAR